MVVHDQLSPAGLKLTSESTGRLLPGDRDRDLDPAIQRAFSSMLALSLLSNTKMPHKGRITE
jgi:hypothetical protein